MLLGPPQKHVIKLPELSQEEMETLRQKPADGTSVLMQGLALSLFDEEDGLHMALGALLESRKGVKPELAKKMLGKRVALLRKGNILAWTQLCKIAKKRLGSPVCQLVLKISPLKEETAA